MSEWKTLTIPEFTDIISGATPATNVQEYWDGDIEWVTPVDLSKLNSRFLKSTLRKISKKGLENSSASLIPANNVVMSSRAPIGYFAIPTKDFTTNQGCKSFKLYQHQDAEFHYYNFLLNIDYFKRFGSGSTFAEISKSDIEKLTFTIPTSLAEQRKIARILSTVDAVIEKTEAVIAKYKAIKSGMMRDLFTRGIDLKTGKLRPRYEDAPELYKESELGWVPKEWEVVQINQVSTLVTNGFVGVATPYYESSDNGVKYLYGTNVRHDEIKFDDIRYVSRLFHNKQIKSQLKTGDMLTVQSGHIGTSAIVPQNLGDANCHALIITRFLLSKIFPWFVSYYLNSDMGMHGLEKLFIGSTIKHINTSELAKHLILKPGIEEQKEISKRIDSIQLLLRNELVNLSKIQNLKQALMTDLLTGKVRVEYEKEKAEEM